MEPLTHPTPPHPQRYRASEVAVAFEDGFETDLGWDLTEGDWGRGTPTGGGGEYGGPIRVRPMTV